MAALPEPGTVGAVASEHAYNDEASPGVAALQIEQRYGEEARKRLRQDMNEQYIDVTLSDKFSRFADDLYVNPAEVRNIRAMFPDDRCDILILGAGLGGILYAARMVQAGIKPERLRIVDSAGGFGGTWYWNRFPGLMCDVESYIYLPLLEEMGYVPKHKYSYGHEIREYANAIARHWGFADGAVFQTKAKSLTWNEDGKEWLVELEQHRNGQAPQNVTIRSRIVCAVGGMLNHPKLPGFPGIADFKGDMFHASRWDYDITGGTQENPEMTKLKDKRVALIGTGATAVQLTPELSRYAKHMYVVQRTPSAVDHRGQHQTDPERFKNEVANRPNWQRERVRNFNAFFTTGNQPDTNLVDDQWTTAQGLCAIAGQLNAPKTMEELPAYIKTLNAIDLPRQQRIRDRVSQIVKDPKTAEKLQPWYPTWCKRPAFHDNYLASFNKPNVTLIDTAGRGLDGMTADSIVFDRVSHAVDLVVFATGYRAPFAGTPAEKLNLKIYGRDGVSMTDEWGRHGPSTLHGVLDAQFPNLLMAGAWQATVGANFLFGTDQLAKHAAYILAESERRAEGKPFAISTERGAAEDWGNQVASRALGGAAMGGCTPGFFTMEGLIDKLTQEQQMILARSGTWGFGTEDFLTHLEAWRAEGGLRGIQIEIGA